MIEALLWDVDGTLAETERDGHRVAFNQAFEALGLAWRWDEARYGELLRVTGGRERLLADMGQRADAPPSLAEREALAIELHRLKNRAYGEIVAGGAIPLRPGVAGLVHEAASRGRAQAIVTTTSRANLHALLGRHFGAGWPRLFGTVVSGEDVAAKKPDPEAYRRALHALGLGPFATLAIEDSLPGVSAARGADVPVMVCRSVYFEHDPIEGAVAIGPGLHTRQGWRPAPTVADKSVDGAITLDQLDDWHSRMDLVSHFC